MAGNIFYEIYRNHSEKKQHSLEVASYFSPLSDEYQVALWHDAVEDGLVTFKWLEDRYSREIVDAIRSITRTKEETYFDYILRVKLNSLARKVKLADLTVNQNRCLKDLTRSSLLKRYQKAEKILKDYDG